LRGIWVWMEGSKRGRRVPGGKRRGTEVGEDDATICKCQYANMVDESDVEGAVGSSGVRAREMDLWRSLTRNSTQDDATVKCWGFNGNGDEREKNGQLGQGDTEDRGDGSDGGCPAQPTRGCGGREEGWGWWLTVLP